MAQEEESGQANDSPGKGARGPVCGERLAEARQARGISLHEIAKELHIDAQKVQALEQNNFDLLGAPVFAKGHLRKYAELVGAPIDDILGDYYTLNRSAGAPPVVGPPRKIVRESSIGRWLGGILLVLIIATVAWWWLSLVQAPRSPEALPAPFEPRNQDSALDRETEPLDGAPADEDAAGVATGPPADSLAELPAGSAAEEPMQIVPADPVAEAQPVAAEEAADFSTQATARTVELVLSFTGECWTEVADATGRRLFFDLGSDGRRVTLTGVEPLRVLLGNSPNASLQVDGFDYVIPAENRRGNTARLTIYGQ